MDERNRTVDVATTAIGFLSEDFIPLSNGKDTWARYGHLDAYLDNDRDVQKAMRDKTCDKCRPNFEVMLAADRAAGLIPEAAG